MASEERGENAIKMIRMDVNSLLSNPAFGYRTPWGTDFIAYIPICLANCMEIETGYIACTDKKDCGRLAAGLQFAIRISR